VLEAMIGLADRAMPSNAMPSNAMQSNFKTIEAPIRSAKVLLVDDEFYMRKVVRTLLLAMGVTDVHDAADGASGLSAIRTLNPDVVLLDWQMDGMNGPEFVRRVRSPDTFAHPNVPVIMLTGHGEHSRVVEAMRLGVHEFLVKPVSGKALYERLASVLLHPRPMVNRDSYYGPTPRALPLRARSRRGGAANPLRPPGPAQAGGRLRHP
jgi:DNA-binding response OmpR family regulator